MRDKYRKEKREEQEKARSGAEGGVKKKWKYLDILAFLEPYNQDRKTTSNFDLSQSATVILNNICSETGQVIKQAIRNVCLQKISVYVWTGV